jgi:7-cyano-7-deazaguanine synthase
MNSPAVVLLSGGLDSATVLAIARNAGHRCFALSFDYNQRHACELHAARVLAKAMNAEEHIILPLDLGTFGGSALTDHIEVPKDRDPETQRDIPMTYVPARNLVFLSLAAAYAETRKARDIYIGVNAIDYSGYPDCRPEFIESFATTVNLATRSGVEGERFTIHTPLLYLTKAEIIQRGTELGVDYAVSHSCYDPDEQGHACGRCDSCVLRRRGFEQAGVPDPTPYA